MIQTGFGTCLKSDSHMSPKQGSLKVSALNYEQQRT